MSRGYQMGTHNTFKDGVFDIILVEHTPNLLELYNYPGV